MYKMYDSQWDEESEDGNSSLNSAFWSDGEEEEEEKVEQYKQEDTEPNRTTEYTQEEPPVAEPPVTERPKETIQEECRGERAKQGEKIDEEGYSTRDGSPALSLLTSGYGTYRPDSSAKDDPEGEDYRDDSTIAEFDRESQGLSEMQYGDEDDQSLANFDVDGAVSGPGERLGGIHVSMSTHQELELESDEAGSLSDRSESDRLPSAFKAYIRGMARSRSEIDIRPQPKSFIRPVKDHPHTRSLKKTDPVAKYFQYKQDWEMFKAPGEKDRKALHWEIREQLAYQPLPAPSSVWYIPFEMFGKYSDKISFLIFRHFGV